MSEWCRIGDDWCEGWIRGMNRVTQHGHDCEAEPVASGVRHRQPTTCDDHTVRLKWFSAILFQLPGGGGSTESSDERVRPELHAVLGRQRQEPIPHISRPVRGGKQFGRFPLLYQSQPEL